MTEMLLRKSFSK